MTDIVLAWKKVQERIQAAMLAGHRTPGTVRLLAVSKTFPIRDVETLFTAGQRAFGENYAQELAEKASILPEAEWHFIGPLQSNKTRLVAQYASWVHSVEREKILHRLSSQRPAHLPPLNICLEVNVSGESTKSGVMPEALPALAQAALQYDNLCLRGLMCIPMETDDSRQLHAQFALLRSLMEKLNQQGFALDTLSMGMTQDLEVAVAEGATMVRVGTAIFGARVKMQA